KSLTESRMISWIWTLTGSVDWKAQAVADLLRDRNYVHKNDFNAIMQGLAAYADEIAVKPSEQVTGLVRRTLEESDYGDGFETPLAMTSWEALLWVHSVSKVLLALRSPSLGELAEAKIARVARAVLDAAPNWPSDARAGTTESL